LVAGKELVRTKWSRMTVILKEHVAELPQPSEPVQVTTVVPTGKVLPLGGLQTTPMGGQPPLADGSQVTTAPAALVAKTVMLAGQVTTIGGHGLTVTVKLQVWLWPQWSLAVQVTVVVPTGKVLPLGGSQVTVVGGQPPVAVL
jgi:hypothetical protein